MSVSTPPSLMPFTGKVSPEWLTRGVWLSEAPLALADGGSGLLLDLLKLASERFTELQDGLTPEAFTTLSHRPERERDRELTGEALVAWRKYLGALSALRVALMGRLMFGTLIAFGDPGRPGADPEWIPVRSWYDLKPDPITRNKVSGDAGAYWYVKVIDLARERLAESRPGDNDASASISSGLAGRPTSKHLYLAEMLRRAEIGELAPSMAAEAKHLQEWLKVTYPLAPSGGKKTIENAIRKEYKRLKLTHPKIIVSTEF